MGLTYNGATAGSTLANPPLVLDGTIAGQFPFGTTAAHGGKLWVHSSTNDVTDFVALNAFNDGVALGMRHGDLFAMVSGTAGSTTLKIQFGVLVTSAAATGFALSSNVLSSTAV